MSDYKHRKSNLDDFKYPLMVSLKSNLINKFYDHLKKEMQNIGAHYFGHSIIKNYKQEGHTVSSFMTNLEWQEKYWESYWDCDPIHFTSHPIAQINGCAIASWKIIDPHSNCMEDRRTTCQMNDGFSFYIQHENNLSENFSFGWKKYDVNQVNRQKLAKLSDMISEFRLIHFKSFSIENG